MSQSIFSILRSSMEHYSKVEQKIAGFILEQPEDLIQASMAQVADAVGVSQGSINNFAKKVVGGGFSALKLQIAQQISSYEQKPFNLVKAGDGIRDTIARTLHETLIAFQNTADMNREETLQNVVQYILQSQKIEIYGIYQSATVAEDFYRKLLQLGLPASYVSDVLLCPVSASMLNQESLVIAISSSGRTKDILDAVQVAKERGASVVCFTSNASGPIATVADEVLITAPSGSNISNRMEEVRLSQLFLIDCLCSYIRYKTDETGEKQYYRLAGIINSHSVYEE